MPSNHLILCRPHPSGISYQVNQNTLIVYLQCVIDCIRYHGEHKDEKDPDAGKDWGQEEKGTTEDEMVGWHH